MALSLGYSRLVGKNELLCSLIACTNHVNKIAIKVITIRIPNTIAPRVFKKSCSKAVIRRDVSDSPQKTTQKSNEKGKKTTIRVDSIVNSINPIRRKRFSFCSLLASDSVSFISLSPRVRII